MSGTGVGVCQIIFSGSEKASLIGSMMQADDEIQHKLFDILHNSLTSSSGICKKSTILLMRSCNCLKPSAKHSRGGIIEEEEMLLVGVISLSDLTSCFSKVSFCGSGTIEREAGGGYLLFSQRKT